MRPKSRQHPCLPQVNSGRLKRSLITSLAAPWNYGDYIGKDSQKRDDRGEEELGEVKEEAEDVALAQREERSSPPIKNNNFFIIQIIQNVLLMFI